MGRCEKIQLGQNSAKTAHLGKKKIDKWMTPSRDKRIK